ncbi:hypothetical protein V6N12_024530 [Hibiscus sabdariffa]|uniref:RING-type E3 ubiquitin transferase n=1 Tax=Hibiscus sabdariffa TaxID=183260 RepID=A0ABR2G118_9ROSI
MFPLFLLFYLLVTSAASVAANHACREQRCGHGPPIRFPFRLKGVHSHHCGYGTGFHLSCSSTNATVMELPSSLELVVSKIDYEAQLLHLSDPTSSLIKGIPFLNLSNSPFQFGSLYSVLNYSVFNC